MELAQAYFLCYKIVLRHGGAEKEKGDPAVTTGQKENVQELAQRTAEEIYQQFLVNKIGGLLKSAGFYSPRTWKVWRRAMAVCMARVVFEGNTDPAKLWGSNTSEKEIVGEILKRADGDDAFKRLVCAGVLRRLLSEEEGELAAHAEAGEGEKLDMTVTMDEGELRRALSDVRIR